METIRTKVLVLSAIASTSIGLILTGTCPDQIVPLLSLASITTMLALVTFHSVDPSTTK